MFKSIRLQFAQVLAVIALVALFVTAVIQPSPAYAADCSSTTSSSCGG
jgi:hypothetical protein